HVPGLPEAGYLTNETIFSLTELPRRLLVIGAGPVGCELAQGFARFGSQVTLLVNHSQILAPEESHPAEIVQKAMERDGVKVVLNAQIYRDQKQGADKVVHLEHAARCWHQIVDEILVAVGRTPNIVGLDLEAAGVEYDFSTGVHVNDRL